MKMPGFIIKAPSTPLCISFGILLLISCNSPRQDKGAVQDGTIPVDSATGVEEPPVVNDPLISKFTDSTGRLVITAGQAAGTLKLKTPSDTLPQVLGKADSVAADMCKDLSSWYSESAALRVYSLCDNDLDMSKSVQAIAISGAPFITESSITGESTFPEIQQSYPDIRIVGRISKGEQTTYIADDIGKGIAFELSDTAASGTVLAVLVHLPQKPVTATNIPFYPALEKP